MPPNEERALNQLGASAIFEIARANRSKRGLSRVPLIQWHNPPPTYNTQLLRSARYHFTRA